MDENNQGRDGYQKFIIFVIIFLIGGSYGFSLGRKAERRGLPRTGGYQEEKREMGPGGSQKNKEAGESTMNVPSGGAVISGGYAIKVDDQAPGSQVNVAMVTLVKDAWVVIHADRDGKPGNIIGAQRFNAGANQTGTVTLQRPTEEGQVYYAMLHEDQGNDHLFDYKKDLPLTSSAGGTIMVRFVATSKPGQQ